jgi:hypothetical protein
MDLSSVEGLTEDQRAAVMAAHDANVEGLKNQQKKLVDEAKTAKAAASENAATVEEARKAASDAEARALESQGKYDEAQKIREEERAKLVAVAESERDKAKNTLDKFHKSQAVNSILNNVLDQFRPAAEAVLDQNINIDYDEQGNVKTMFRHGEQEFSSASDFINGVGEDAMWGGMLKGAVSSGAGTKQVNTNVSGVGVPMSLADCKGDAELERQYYKNQRSKM